MPRQRSGAMVLTKAAGIKSWGRPRHQSNGVPRSGTTSTSGTVTPSRSPIRFASSSRPSGPGTANRNLWRNLMIRLACPRRTTTDITSHVGNTQRWSPVRLGSLKCKAPGAETALVYAMKACADPCDWLGTNSSQDIAGSILGTTLWWEIGGGEDSG